MVDLEKLEKIFSSWKKADEISFADFETELQKLFSGLQTGVFTSTDFTNIRYLQGIGALTSTLLTAMAKVKGIDFQTNTLQ